MRTVKKLAKALFGTWGNALVSVLLLGGLGWGLGKFFVWSVASATWVADSRATCAPGGACWAMIGAKFRMYLYGNYPQAAEWRVHLALAMLLACLAGCVLSNQRRSLWLGALFLSLPVDAVILTGGFYDVPFVPTSEWGGLMLNVILAVVSILVSIPLGIALAFARRSQRRRLSLAATVFIEFWRAVPLLAVLFMGVVMLPLFLPTGVTVDNLVRALLVLVVFTSAYMAEVFRGALQTIPKGQEEAAAALGLSPALIAMLVVLPQALRMAVPGIVNIAVDLFKDTSLVSIVGLFDLVGMTAQSIKDPAWLGLTGEAYGFSAALFSIWCLLISLSGQIAERRLSLPWRHAR